MSHPSDDNKTHHDHSYTPSYNPSSMASDGHYSYNDPFPPSQPPPLEGFFAEAQPRSPFDPKFNQSNPYKRLREPEPKDARLSEGTRPFLNGDLGEREARMSFRPSRSPQSPAHLEQDVPLCRQPVSEQQSRAGCNNYHYHYHCRRRRLQPPSAGLPLPAATIAYPIDPRRSTTLNLGEEPRSRVWNQEAASVAQYAAANAPGDLVEGFKDRPTLASVEYDGWGDETKVYWGEEGEEGKRGEAEEEGGRNEEDEDDEEDGDEEEDGEEEEDSDGRDHFTGWVDLDLGQELGVDHGPNGRFSVWRWCHRNKNGAREARQMGKI